MSASRPSTTICRDAKSDFYLLDLKFILYISPVRVASWNSIYNLLRVLKCIIHLTMFRVLNFYLQSTRVRNFHLLWYFASWYNQFVSRKFHLLRFRVQMSIYLYPSCPPPNFNLLWFFASWVSIYNPTRVRNFHLLMFRVPNFYLQSYNFHLLWFSRPGFLFTIQTRVPKFHSLWHFASQNSIYNPSRVPNCHLLWCFASWVSIYNPTRVRNVDSLWHFASQISIYKP